MGDPFFAKSTANPSRPVGWAAAAMTSSEGSGQIISSQGSMGTQEEQEVGATPTRGWCRYRTGRESEGALTPASRSSPSELGSILSASDDDSRPVTKREVELLQVRIKGMFSNLRAALNDEVQRRDTVDTLVAGQIETLQSQLPALNSQLTALNAQLQFQQGALASSRERPSATATTCSR